jgi:hypothetical protein
MSLLLKQTVLITNIHYVFGHAGNYMLNFLILGAINCVISTTLYILKYGLDITSCENTDVSMPTNLQPL